MKRSNRVLQFVVVVLLGLSTCASTPGYVGGCNTQADVADPVEFCQNKQAAICARNNAVAPDSATYMACVGGIAGMCAGFNWAVGCAPSQQAANACLSALVEPARITQPPESFGECMLCGGGGIDPEGI